MFLIYISDIPQTPQVNLSLFADGMYRTSHSEFFSRNKIQRQLNVIEKYYKNWKIKINAEKSEAIMFSKGKVLEPTPDLKLLFNGEEVKFKTCVKYMGHRNLSHKMTTSMTIYQRSP